MINADKTKTARACSLWNALTNPAALLTDAQHETRRKRARKLWSAYVLPGIERGWVKEWSSGRVSVTR